MGQDEGGGAERPCSCVAARTRGEFFKARCFLCSCFLVSYTQGKLQNKLNSHFLKARLLHHCLQGLVCDGGAGADGARRHGRLSLRLLFHLPRRHDAASDQTLNG